MPSIDPSTNEDGDELYLGIEMNHASLAQAITRLLGCGHDHSFRVETKTWRLYLKEEAIRCAFKKSSVSWTNSPPAEPAPVPQEYEGFGTFTVGDHHEPMAMPPGKYFASLKPTPMPPHEIVEIERERIRDYLRKTIAAEKSIKPSGPSEMSQQMAVTQELETMIELVLPPADSLEDYTQPYIPIDERKKPTPRFIVGDEMPTEPPLLDNGHLWSNDELNLAKYCLLCGNPKMRNERERFSQKGCTSKASERLCAIIEGREKL